MEISAGARSGIENALRPFSRPSNGFELPPHAAPHLEDLGGQRAQTLLFVICGHDD
jgi:hypothetical protein